MFVRFVMFLCVYVCYLTYISTRDEHKYFALRSEENSAVLFVSAQRVYVVLFANMYTKNTHVYTKPL